MPPEFCWPQRLGADCVVEKLDVAIDGTALRLAMISPISSGGGIVRVRTNWAGRILRVERMWIRHTKNGFGKGDLRVK